MIERRLYQERPARHEYRLTEKGRDLYPVIVSLTLLGQILELRARAQTSAAIKSLLGLLDP